ncbi:PREDICTED: uncharacterized protein LOC108762452 [Trachymyrmex cornetzi]|uniref:uncharacterized protein LOC108762452 n=1 Tax=Trachymyrmex cornetzi TaxID=471704 RepID=UPI00084EDC68|nr:PREDICTED: uncharacterized protein LOC108762452 [Trachymyrmex cornetzi]
MKREVSAFHDSSFNRAAPRKFRRVLSTVLAQCFVPAKVRALRKSRIAFARFERRPVLSLGRLYPVGTASPRRRKREEENVRDAERRDARREERLRAEGETREEEAHTHARTHIYTKKRTKRSEWALASPGRGLVTSACRRRPKEK